MAHGRCPEHQRAHERARGSAHERGYDREHQRRREIVLARDPLCVACLAMDRVTASTVYDHIVPIEAGGSERDLDNAQGLCARDHALKRAAESRGRQMLVIPGRGLVDVGPLRAAVAQAKCEGVTL